MKKIFTVLTVLLVLFSFGCDQSLGDQRIANTAIPAASTQIFANSDLDSLASVSSNGASDTIVMSGAVADFPVGSHLIFDNSEKTPGGRLYKVESVSDNGNGTVTIVTSMGLLADALEDANVSYTGVLSNDKITEIESLAMDARAISFSGDYTFNLGQANIVAKIEEWAKADYGNSPVKASDILKFNLGGTIQLKPVVNIDLKIEKGAISYMLFDLGADMKTSLLVDGGIDYTFSQDIPLFKLNYAAITIMAGPVPIVFTPQFDIILNVRAGIQASLTMKVSQETSLRVCAEKIGSADWDTSKSKAKFSAPTFDGVYPKIKLSAGVTLTEKAGLCLYGALGVSATLSEFADFNATILPGEVSLITVGDDMAVASWQDLYKGNYQFQAGVAASVNIRISALGFINKDFSVWGDRWVLAQWDMNEETGYEKNPETGIYGKWTFPAIQHLIK